jgi:hypothetical protein
MKTAGESLIRALEERGMCRILAAAERPWASATFVGAQHQVRIAVAATYLENIEEDVFELGGHLLADLVVVDRKANGAGLIIDLEALTIEDWRAPAEAGAQAASGVVQPRISASAGARSGWSERERTTDRGTKRAFVPLAAA